MSNPGLRPLCRLPTAATFAMFTLGFICGAVTVLLAACAAARRYGLW